MHTLRLQEPRASIFFTVRRVLVVDDEENIRLVLRTLLKRHGYEVETAPGGEEALGLVEVAVGAHDDDGGVIAFRAQRAEQVHPAHARHAHVGQHAVRAERVHQRKRLVSIRRGFDFVAVTSQQGAQDHPQVLFVVDYQNAPHCEKNASFSTIALQLFAG